MSTTPIWETLDTIELTPDKIVPCGTRVLIKRMERAKKAGKIIIPETAQQPQYIAKIIAVGNEAMEEGFKVGEYVIIGRWNASSFRLLEHPDKEYASEMYEDYSIIDTADIWCKVNGVS